MSKHDAVNHPKHYQLGNLNVEAIDIVEEVCKNLPGDEAVSLGNVLKYLIRAENKNGLQDYEKARWYLNRLIDKMKSKTK